VGFGACLMYTGGVRIPKLLHDQAGSGGLQGRVEGRRAKLQLPCCPIGNPPWVNHGSLERCMHICYAVCYAKLTDPIQLFAEQLMLLSLNGDVTIYSGI
jgi:hypothetical protein